MHAPTTAQSALDYAARGWAVIPLRPGEKRPLIRWDEFQRRRPTTIEVAEWFRRWSGANVGIITGVVSHILVLDIDPQHGGDDSLAKLEALHGPLPDTVALDTGGGGWHLYLQHPGGAVHNRVALMEGVDLRGDGGYVVAPPSFHPCGAQYRWREGRGPTEIKLAAMPPWLAELVEQSGHRAGHPLPHWRNLVREGVSEGQRNNTVASLTGHLLWHGVDADVALELMLSWNRIRCRPPLSDDEVAQTVQSIERLSRKAKDQSAESS